MLFFWNGRELLISAESLYHWSNSPKKLLFFKPKVNFHQTSTPLKFRHPCSLTKPNVYTSRYGISHRKQNKLTHKKKWTSSQPSAGRSWFFVSCMTTTVPPRPVRGGFVSCLWLPAKRFYQGKDLFFGREPLLIQTLPWKLTWLAGKSPWFNRRYIFKRLEFSIATFIFGAFSLWSVIPCTIIQWGDERIMNHFS